MRIRRIALAGALAVGLVAVGAGVASAHVTVSAPGATSGGDDQIITFRVPTESDTASTTALSVQLPTDTPIASVLAQPVPGWTIKQTMVKLAKPIVTDDGDITNAVSRIDWTADTAADAIPPDQFQEFVVIAGQLPKADSLTFRAIQTYSDGTVVNWTDVNAPGSNAELDHPAPVLSLAADSDPAAPAASTSSHSSSNTGPTVLAIIALVVAAAALGIAVVGRIRQRSAT